MTAPHEEVIVTPRLRLVPIELRHGPAVEAFSRTWEAARYTSEIPHPCPAGYGTRFAEECVHNRRHGGDLMWVIQPREGEEVFGASGLFFAPDQRSADVGYVYAPWAWGRGYATEGARAVVTFGFARLGLDTICAYTAMANPASSRVLAKVGLRRIGDVREWAPARGCFFDWEAHRVTRQEWQS